MHERDLRLAVRPPVPADQRDAAGGELSRRIAVARTMFLAGDDAGSSSLLLDGVPENLRRFPHEDPRDQARALRGLARGSEATHPADAIDMYREALELFPGIRDVKDRLKLLEARLAAASQSRR